MLFQGRPLHILRQPAVASPMERSRAAPVWNDESQRGKILEQIALDQLHERRCVGVDVVSPGGVERRHAAPADVDHGGHVQLHHLFVKRIPPFIRDRRRVPVTARRIWIEIAPDEAEFHHAPLQFPDAIIRSHARRLRQLAHAHEVLGINHAHAMDHVVARDGPVQAGLRVANVMPHHRRPRRKNGEIRAALALELELRAFKRLADLIIADVHVPRRGDMRRLLEPVDLALAVCF